MTFTGIDWAGDMFLMLIAIGGFAFGWIMGMLHMRANYLSLLKADRIEKKRMTRRAERREKEARMTGFVVGYREGSRVYPRGMLRE